MSERDRGDRPKKSWRELDNQRDRNSPRPSRDSSERRSNDAGMDARASKQYRAALDALFAKGEVGKLAEKLTGGPAGGRHNAVDLVTGKQPEPPPAPSAPPSTAERAPEPKEPRAAAPPPSAPAKDPKEDGRAALRKKVIEALGRDDISRCIDRYVKAHGWPNDFEILEQALEHNKEERQAEAMEHLDKLLAREKPKRSRTLAGKLRFIEETSDSSELRELAAKIRAKL